MCLSHFLTSKSPIVSLVNCSHTARYKCNIQLAGATIIYVPLTPPPNGATEKASAAEWTLDVQKLVNAITTNTRMIVSLSKAESWPC